MRKSPILGLKKIEPDTVVFPHHCRQKKQQTTVVVTNKLPKFLNQWKLRDERGCCIKTPVSGLHFQTNGNYMTEKRSSI
jgi:hypothetical protein